MAIGLFVNPQNELERKANIKMFKKEKTIQCPLCHSETIHEHENDLHWIACQSKACKEVFEVSKKGNVWKFCQRCSQWEYDCECLPEDDC